MAAPRRVVGGGGDERLETGFCFKGVNNPSLSEGSNKHTLPLSIVKQRVGQRRNGRLSKEAGVADIVLAVVGEDAVGSEGGAGEVGVELSHRANGGPKAEGELRCADSTCVTISDATVNIPVELPALTGKTGELRLQKHNGSWPGISKPPSFTDAREGVDLSCGPVSSVHCISLQAGVGGVDNI